MSKDLEEKSTMGIGNYQPLAEDKGLSREVESEEAREQNPKLGDTNNIRHILMGRVYLTKRSPVSTQSQVCKCCGYRRINLP